MNASQIFDNVLAIAKSDVILAAGPPVITFLTNVSAKPLDAVNFVAQVDLLRSSLTAAIPNLAQEEVTQLNASFISVIEAELAKAKAAVEAGVAAQQAVAKAS